MSNTRTTISNKVKAEVVERQGNRCANNPFNPCINLSDYKCPFWMLNGGLFDSSGFDIDHIEEFSITGNNDINNLQALCKCCHSVKTKKYMKYVKTNLKLTSRDLDRGAMPMDIDKDKPVSKKRKIE